jgi:hypothetical protein
VFGEGVLGGYYGGPNVANVWQLRLTPTPPRVFQFHFHFLVHGLPVLSLCSSPSSLHLFAMALLNVANRLRSVVTHNAHVNQVCSLEGPSTA